MSKEFYENVYKQGLVDHWDDSPGKKVILAAYGELGSGNVVLDIGMGNGYFLDKIRQATPEAKKKRFIGIDIAQSAVDNAKSRYPEMEFHQMDAEALKLHGGSVDVAISYGCFEHFSHPDVAIKELARVLRKGGLFLMMMPALDYYRQDRTDEGWYHDLDKVPQLQWNYKRVRWESFFKDAGLELFPIEDSKRYGALKPGVFFFGKKP